MAVPVVLAVDAGSSSLRCGAYDAAGRPVHGPPVARQYELRLDAAGRAELDPQELFGHLVSALDELLERLRPHDVDVVGVATDTLMHSLLGVDAAGEPTTPVLTWADRRAGGAAAGLRERLAEDAVHARTGCMLHSSYWPAKLAWLAGTEPDVVARTATWLTPGEYLQRRLLASPGVSTSQAAATGLLDQRTGGYDAALLDVLGLAEAALPPLRDEPADDLGEQWARRWPALAGVPWWPAVGDGPASNVGAGCLTRDRLALMIGTSGALRVLARASASPTSAHTPAGAAGVPPVPPGLWCYRVDRSPDSRYLVGGALSDGGNLVAWLRSTLQLPEPAQLERALGELAPDGHGLTVLPLLMGERGPGWADSAHGTITGLSQATTPLQMLHACLEAVALRFALIAGLLRRDLPAHVEVVATGGALRASGAWVRILADALGVPVLVSAVEEASSRGAALLAWEALGGAGPLETLPAPAERTVVPDPARHEAYQRALARQLALYRQVL